MINSTFRKKFAVAEVVGGILLIIIAVLAYAVLQNYLIPDEPKTEEKIQLVGYVNNKGTVVIEHVGGYSISNYISLIYDINGNLISKKEYRQLDPPWKIGESKYPLEDINYPPLINTTDLVEIVIVVNNKNNLQQEVFRGVLSGSYTGDTNNSPILISSLRTNSPDEDLICYSYPVIPDVAATTYIYKWLLNGAPIADLIMPFNTESNISTKDYSGYNNHATVVGQTSWTSQGVLGGAYYFRGSQDHITMNLPNVFSDIPNNDFTISLWVKNSDISADNAVVLLASKDNDNFVKIFLYDSQIHIGVCFNGIKDAVRTENLLNNQWYHIAAVWSANRKSAIVYCNGEEFTIDGYKTYAVGVQDDFLNLGCGTASSKFWNGYMDELEIYNRALSKEQIYQLYLSSKDGDYDRRIIVSKETNIGNTWQCVVTPNDGIQDGTAVYSNILNIINYPGGN